MADKHTREPVILGAARTAQGKFMGGLASLSVAELGSYAFRSAVERDRKSVV